VPSAEKIDLLCGRAEKWPWQQDVAKAFYFDALFKMI